MRKYRHKNILPLFCSFVHGSNLWLVMPWVSGGTLCEVIRARCARLTVLRAAGVIFLGLHHMSATCLLTEIRHGLANTGSKRGWTKI